MYFIPVWDAAYMTGKSTNFILVIINFITLIMLKLTGNRYMNFKKYDICAYSKC